jgi:hypothetical protein
MRREAAPKNNAVNAQQNAVPSAAAIPCASEESPNMAAKHQLSSKNVKPGPKGPMLLD